MRVIPFVLCGVMVLLISNAAIAGLVTYFPMDDQEEYGYLTEAVTGDTTGAILDVASNTISVTGKYGNAINFADAHYASVNNSDARSALLGLSSFTFSTWVNGYADAASDMLFTFSDGSFANRIQIQQHGGNISDYEAWAGGGHSAGTGALDWSGGWHHIAFVADGTGSLTYYYDGTAINSTTNFKSPSDAAFNGSLSLMMIGALNYNYFHSATLDEVAFFDEALEPFQVKAIYDAQDASIVYNIPDTPPGVAATYIGVDNTTAQDWNTTYGTDGYSMLNGDDSNLPSYVTGLDIPLESVVDSTAGFFNDPDEVDRFKWAYVTSSLTIERESGSDAFRLVVGIGADNPTSVVENGLIVGATEIAHVDEIYDSRKPYVSYEIFDIPAGSDPIQIFSEAGICFLGFETPPTPVASVSVAVPEPSSVVLLLAGLLGLLFFRCHRLCRSTIRAWFLALFLTASCTLSAQAALVSYLPMDDDLSGGSGVVWDQASGEYAYLTTADDISVTGKFGSGLDLNAGDYVAMQNPAVFQALDNYTVSTWVYGDYDKNVESHMIFTISDGTYANRIQCQLHHESMGFYQQSPVSAGTITESASLTWADQWYHLTYVFNNGVIRVYRDGRLVSLAEGTLSPSNSAFWNEYNESVLTIPTVGGLQPGGHTLKGKIDEFALFDEALAPNQIEAIAGATSADIVSNLPAADWGSSVTVSGGAIDTTTTWQWRDASVTKVNDADGDNIYGTDGYYIPDPDETIVALPDYITSVDCAYLPRWYQSPHVWLEGAYGMMEDPDEPGTPMIAANTESGLFTLERNGSTEAFSITLGLPGINPDVSVDRVLTVFLGSDQTGVDFTVNDPIFAADTPQMTYLTFDVPSGSEDILLYFQGYNPSFSLIAFDSTGSKIAGDANNDGKVDGSDVTILAGNWQKGVSDGQTATWGDGDFNNDGKVDGSDVTILAGNWQFGVTAAAASVPEPSLLVLVFGMAISIFLGRNSFTNQKRSTTIGDAKSGS